MSLRLGVKDALFISIKNILEFIFLFSLKTEKKLDFNYNKDDYWIPKSYYVIWSNSLLWNTKYLDGRKFMSMFFEYFKIIYYFSVNWIHEILFLILSTLTLFLTKLTTSTQITSLKRNNPLNITWIMKAYHWKYSRDGISLATLWG